MRIASLWLTCMFISANFVFATERDHRFVRIFQFPATPVFVVVAEGELEPRSVGSYTVRIYAGSSDKFPTDDFIVGVVRPRNGIVETVRFDDVDGDDKPDLVVMIRSAGSGGYVSADAFRYRNRSLELIGSVSDLDKQADPIKVLRDKLKTPAADQSQPRS